MGCKPWSTTGRSQTLKKIKSEKIKSFKISGNNFTSVVVDQVAPDFILMTEKGEWNKYLRPISFTLKALIALFDSDVLRYFSVENTGQIFKFASVRSCPQLCFISSVFGSQMVEIVDVDYSQNCQEHIDYISHGNSNHFFGQSWLHL